MSQPQPIATLVYILDQYLFQASGAAKEACEAIVAGKQNLAIGTLIPIERQCYDALALLRVILSLHSDANVSSIGGVR